MIILIPIKKNSKRLKNKNFKLINKIPLYKLTTNFAKKYFSKDQILISTDCEKTAKKLKSEGLQVPFLRPKSLAKSSSSIFSVAKHAVTNFEIKINKSIDTIILLQPTSPFRSINELKKAIKLFRKNNLPTMSVSRLQVMSDKIYFYKRRNIVQAINYYFKRKSYIPNGSFYIISKKDLFKSKNFYKTRMNFVELKKFKNKIDIDYHDDLELAKKQF